MFVCVGVSFFCGARARRALAVPVQDTTQHRARNARMTSTSASAPLPPPVEQLPLLPKEERPQPNAIRGSDGRARLATPHECSSGKANLFVATSVEELRALGFSRVCPAPHDESVATAYSFDLDVADEAPRPICFVHPALSKTERIVRRATRRATSMIVEVAPTASTRSPTPRCASSTLSPTDSSSVASRR